MLEKMDAFFAARLEGYDDHMLTEIEGARAFYPYTASLLPKGQDASILDLGCGTGLELEAYFRLGGKAAITGIDLSREMLDALQKKLADRMITLIHGSYFDVPLGENCFDAAVSVESLHHFPAERKLELYGKLKRALKTAGYFVLTDYFAESEALEQAYFSNLARLEREQGQDGPFLYHYDTPLTTDHEMDVLSQAGFSDVKIMNQWGTTYTLFAKR